MKTTRRFAAAITLPISTILLLVACGSEKNGEITTSNSIQPSIVTQYSSSAIDLGDQRQVAGWADAVFAGTVEEFLGTQDLGAGMPESQFRVTVLETLKGEIPDEVIINQGGGLNREGELVVIDEDELVSVGSSYLFSARVFEEKGWLTLANAVGSLPIDNEEAESLDPNNGSRRQTNEPSVISNMRDSLANEIPFGDEGSRQTTLPSAISPTSISSTSVVPTTLETTPSPVETSPQQPGSNPNRTDSTPPHPTTTETGAPTTPR